MAYRRVPRFSDAGTATEKASDAILADARRNN